jgi:flagellar protein FlaI
MPKTLLPFEVNEDKGGLHQREPNEHDELFRSLPEELQAACQEHRHLWEYLCLLPLDEVSIPEYYSELKRSMGDRKGHNLIYPVGGGIFIHLYSGSSESRATYISIEPGMTEDLSTVLPLLEGKLVDETYVLGTAISKEEKAEAFVELVERICVGQRSSTGAASSDRRKENGKKVRNRGKKSSLQVTPGQLRALKYIVVRDKVGMGIIEAMIRDSYIEDISCSGVGPIFLEHKIFKGISTATVFESHDDLDNFVLNLSEAIKKPVTLRKPIVDATLPDGSRINIVFGREVSRRGSNFTIRKFGETPISIMELIEFGSLDYEMAAYISLIIESEMSMFVVGETASGKTTLLNAVTTFIPLRSRIVSIEDTPELQVPHANWIREVAKAPAPGEHKAQVDMFDLLKAALRQRPNVIIVGEIRGVEGNIAFGAMQSGHEVLSTFHASNVEKLIQRLTGNPINVPKTYMDNLNVVICQNAVKLPNGKIGRRATSISEIVGYDPVSETFSYVEVFHWNQANDSFEFIGKKNSYLLEERIAIKRGIPPGEKWRIYDVVERRAKILKKLHKDKGVTDFFELLKVLAKAQQEGLF